ncbi:hypothetical protein [Actinokineospora globicatena]|uniref:hypothetical protein n=1 Tax=Actinokineospora globicatena TaxID=103729 RepID=UPI0020A422EC|nr:hypothetical protein [Actinokineospora globicatena]MCP2301165.1 hypothetical protein [Actinokineospora globicatena]GLW77199.1 hypothetical protein Aglo01_16810 [Actinokineospora globicatena]GLW84033.1 hypothetical protein Aglo02_16730 [Actinokineospora globicatena]
MGYARELADPWGLLLAASAAGVAYAIHLPAWMTVGVAVVVLGGKAGIARLVQEPEEPVPAIEPDSAEDVWLRRFHAARAEFDPRFDETMDVLDRVLRRFAVRASAIVRVDVAADDADELKRLTDTYNTLISQFEAVVTSVEELVGAADPAEELAEVRAAALRTERATRGWGETGQEPKSARLRNG